MKYRMTALALCFGACSLAQTVTGLGNRQAGPRTNFQTLSQRTPVQRQAASRSPGVVVFTGDRVIPQFVDGASWQTTITVVNLENHATSFDVLFLDDRGNDFFVPIEGFGAISGLTISLDTAASYTFGSTGTSINLASGWALLSCSFTG